MEVVFNQVDFKYNDNLVLDHFTWRVPDGQISAIIGVNGSGKSTLMSLINQLLEPTKGQVIISDFDKYNLHQLVGLVSINSQFRFQTVYEEFEYYLELINYTTGKRHQHIQQALVMLGLDNIQLDRNINTLSNSEKILLKLALVLSINPKILIIDSVLDYLDSYHKKQLIKIIKKLKRRYQKTIIIISNDIDTMHKVIDYVYILSKGQIVLEGNKYEVFSKVQELKKYKLKVPQIIALENIVYENKKIKLGYRDDINDLLKDIYRNIE